MHASLSGAKRPLFVTRLITTGVAVVSGLTAGALALGGGVTFPGNGAGFEIDDVGSLYSGDGALSGIASGDDWAQGDAGTGVLDADGLPVGSFVASRVVDQNWGTAGDGFDPTKFNGGSNKNDDLIGADQAPWSWYGGGGGPQKNDITNTYFHARVDSDPASPTFGHRWVFVGAETRSTNGDSHVDFEFNQAGIELVGDTSGQLVGLGPDGGRTIEDFVVSIDFEIGGGQPTASVRKWTGSSFELVDVPGFIFSATNIVDIPHGADGVWRHFASDGSETEVLGALQLVEAGVDLTALGIEVDPCSAIATFIAKTRSSQSFTAELKDFALVPFPLEPTPQCQIDGPAEVCPGAETNYTVTELGGLEDVTFEWTISGDGTFCDGSTMASGDSVCVAAASICGGSYELIVTVTGDECSSSCAFGATIDDSEGPEITCPPDVTFECDAVGDGGVATATDNCDEMPAIAFTDVEEPGDCPQESTITRTWTATDACGNSSMCVQTITIVDTTAPEIVCPPDVTFECDAVVDGGVATATDNCDEMPAIAFTDVEAPGDCPQESTITRTWTATDACDNSSMCVQTITIVDTTAPEIVCPPDVTFECDAVVDGGVATATDNCDEMPAIAFTDVEEPGDCPQESTITRTWTATDACGNSSMCVQTITIVDTTAPEIVCPPDVTFECDAVGDGSVATATDNCDEMPAIAFTDVEEPGDCPQESTITRTWTATDACDNSSMCVQTITIVDTTPPTLTCPPDVTVACSDDVPDPALDLAAFESQGGTATDNCGDVTLEFVGDVTDGGSCPELITRTYRATDACGNVAECEQLITVDDDEPPAITSCPDGMELECEVPFDFTIEAADNCGVVSITCDLEASDPDLVTLTDLGGGSFTVLFLDTASATVSCIATDACGNESTVCSFVVFANCDGGEGCTPGYWRQPQHFFAWASPYARDGLFGDVFEDAFPGKTLLQVIHHGGGGLSALGRHTVAALLNAGSPGVSYDLSVADVIGLFNDVYPGTDDDYEALKDFFEFFNEQGCPLGADTSALGEGGALGALVAGDRTRSTIPGDAITTSGAATGADDPSGLVPGERSMDTSAGDEESSEDVDEPRIVFVNDDFLAPGAHGGRLVLAGDYQQGEHGVLLIGVAASATGTVHDELIVEGEARLNGTLVVAFDDGYSPRVGDAFVFLRAASIEGTFAWSAVPRLDGGRLIEVEYGPQAVRLQVVAGVSSADITGDRQVDADDLVALLSSFGGDDRRADLDGDGVVGVEDLAMLLDLWGSIR